MPLITESTTSTPDFDDSDLLADGELTLEAEAVSDFLTHADFSGFFDHPALKPLIATVEETETDEDGKESKVEYEVLFGGDVAEHVDDTDLFDMFLTFVDESLSDEGIDATMRRAAIGGMLDEKAPFKKGGFKKLIKAKGAAGHALVKRMMMAMVKKGVLKRQKKDSSTYQRGPGYKSGGTSSAKKAVARFKDKNKAKLAKAAKKSRKAMKNKGKKVESEELHGVPVFGLGVPVVSDGQRYTFVIGCQDGITPKAASGDTVVAETRVVAESAHSGARLASSMLGTRAPAVS